MKQVGSKKALQLIVRQRELKAVYDLLSQVKQFGKSKKHRWLRENSELVTDAFLSFLEMNKQDVDLMSFTGETGKLSLEILDLLDKTTTVMESALDPKGRLEA